MVLSLLQHGITHGFALSGIKVSHAGSQRAHTGDVARAFGDGNSAARVQQVERVRTLHAVIVSRERQLGFDEAQAFLLDYKAFKCESWLMDPQLAKILGEDSNITKFVNRFIPACGRSAGRGVFSFVFLQPKPAEAVIENLPEDTSLQRKLKEHYLNGGCIYEMHGFIPKDRI